MIQLAIVEDEVIYSDRLTEYVRRFEKESGRTFKVRLYPDGEAFLAAYKSQFDIVLLDIMMPHLDGMSAAKRIREMDGEVIIIFITNRVDCAIGGYGVDAMDYVLKPVDYFSFSSRLKKALDRLGSRKNRSIVLQISEGMKRMEVGSILYVESMGHKLFFHTLSGNVETRANLKDIAALLSEYGFFRISKSYLVNLEHVEGIRKNDCILGKTALPIGRSMKGPFMEALTRYIAAR